MNAGNVVDLIQSIAILCLAVAVISLSFAVINTIRSQ